MIMYRLRPLVLDLLWHFCIPWVKSIITPYYVLLAMLLLGFCSFHFLKKKKTVVLSIDFRKVTVHLTP